MTAKDEKILQSQIEAILFSYGDWIYPKEMAQTLDKTENEIEKQLHKLIDKFEDGFSFHVEQDEENRFRMVLKEEYDGIVTDLISGTEIPASALKVLSVIAYEQPVTKTRMNEILGRVVKDDLDYLSKRKFIDYKKQGIGKYFRVTKKFYEYFNMEKTDKFRDRADESIKEPLKAPEEIIKEIEDREKIPLSEQIDLHAKKS